MNERISFFLILGKYKITATRINENVINIRFGYLFIANNIKHSPPTMLNKIISIRLDKARFFALIPSLIPMPCLPTN